jgi:hypothetical protein
MKCIDCKHCVKLPDGVCEELGKNDLYVCAIPQYIENSDLITQIKDNDYLWLKCEVVMMTEENAFNDNDDDCEWFECKA